MGNEIKFRVYDLESGNYGDDAYKEINASDHEILEQSTGAKDKHGKEIFVGDILRVTFVFNDEKTQLIDVQSLELFYQWNWNNVKDVEIIGNIHDTKDLIKVLGLDHE